MQAVLTQINALPGVVGSMMCDEDGRLAAQVFPELFDVSMIEEAATFLAESALGFQSATGAVDLLDLRYSDARIVVRPMPQSFLLLFCTKAVNMQLLAISLNVATKKLERLFAASQAQPDLPAPEPVTAAIPSAAAAKPREKAIVMPLKQAPEKAATTYWGRMVEKIALSHAKAQAESTKDMLDSIR